MAKKPTNQRGSNARGATAATTSRQAKVQQAAAANRQGPSPVTIAGIVAILAIIAVVAWVIIANNNANKKAAQGGSNLPAGVTAMGQPFTLGTPRSGAPKLDIYEDFQCPGCHQFETMFGATVKKLANAGTVDARYHVMSFLDDRYPNDNSKRAAGAAFCASTYNKFGEVHDLIYKNQPATEGQGWTDAQLTQYAKDAGIGGTDFTAWQKCYTDKAMQQYILSMQKAAATDGVTSTPTIKLNGKDLNLAGMDAAAFEKAVLGK